MKITYKILILVGLAVVIIGGIILTYFFKGSHSQGGDSSQKTTFLTGSVLSRRYLADSALKFSRSISFSQDIYSPLYSQNRLFVRLWKESQIAQIDSVGNILTRYGKKGRAPGEFSSITNITVDHRGMFIIDGTNLTLSHFTLEGKFLTSTPLKTGINAAAHLSGTKYLIQSLEPGDADNELFQIHDVNTGSSNPITVPRLLKSQTSASGRTMEFALYPVNNNFGKIFFMYLASGQFMAFDTAGHFLYQRKTIDESPLPKIIVRKLGKDDLAMPAPGSREINLAAHADERYLYILSNALSPDIVQLTQTTNKTGVIDVYDIKTGSYRHSIKIPPLIVNGKEDFTSTPRQITVVNNGIYILMGVNSLCFFTFHSENL